MKNMIQQNMIHPKFHPTTHLFPVLF